MLFFYGYKVFLMFSFGDTRTFLLQKKRVCVDTFKNAETNIRELSLQRLEKWQAKNLIFM